MAQNKERLTKAGDYNLDVAEILSYRMTGGVPGQQQPYSVNILPIITQIEINEGIFNKSVLGRIQVYDTQDVRTVLPIVGLERLNLKFHTPGLDGICAVANEGHPFHIYKIDQVAPDSKAVAAGGQVYDIYFCSRESYFNLIRKVSKAYDGPVELGVEDIFKNRNYLNSKKNLYVEPTKYNTKMVMPNVRPFQAIDMLAKKAVSGLYENAGYLFYETKDGYNFRSIESLLAVAGSVARPAKFAYYYQMGSVRHPVFGSKDIVADMHGVYSWDLNRPSDTLNNLAEGGYASKLIEHDMFYKTINTTEYDYAKDFGNHFHTEHKWGNKSNDKTPLPKAKFDDTFKTLSQAYDQKLMVKSHTSNIHDTAPTISDKHTTQKAISQRQLLSVGQLELNVPGNSALQAGDIITFDMPIMQPTGHKKEIVSSPFWAGRYLIYEMKHIIDRSKDTYSMILKCCKDNVAKSYVAEYNSWTHSAPRRKTYNIYETDKEIITRMGTNAQGLTTGQHKAFRT